MDSLEVKADGSFIATWTEGGDVYGRLYDANTNPVSAAFRINQYTTKYTGILQSFVRMQTVILSLCGESQGQDGSLNGVYMRRFAADGTALGNEVAVATHMAGDQYWPVMTMDRYGNFVVALGRCQWIGRQWELGLDAAIRQQRQLCRGVSAGESNDCRIPRFARDGHER